MQISLEVRSYNFPKKRSSYILWGNVHQLLLISKFKSLNVNSDIVHRDSIFLFYSLTTLCSFILVYDKQACKCVADMNKQSNRSPQTWVETILAMPGWREKHFSGNSLKALQINICAKHNKNKPQQADFQVWRCRLVWLNVELCCLSLNPCSTF